MFLRATVTQDANTRFLWTLFKALCYSYLCCLVCRDDLIRVAEHTVWCCRKGFPASRERLFRELIMPVWRCRKHRPVCRECAWRLPYWYKRMCEWVRMVLRERFYTGCVFCFAIFCCQNFLLWKCIFMHSAIAFLVGGAHCSCVSLRWWNAMEWGMTSGNGMCLGWPDSLCDCGWILPLLRYVALTEVLLGRDLLLFYSVFMRWLSICVAL